MHGKINMKYGNIGQGDAFRWIHHKLSYKSGKLMIREFENVSHSERFIYSLLDLSGSIMQCKETLALLPRDCKSTFNQKNNTFANHLLQ